MRTIAFVALMGSLLSWTAAATAQDRSPWVADWREARNIAQQQQRLVLLHFYSDACAPCQKLERDVFPRPEVGRALSTGYVAVKINVDRFPQLRDHYKVEAWPTDVIVTPDGKEVSRSVPSPADPNRYIAMLDSARAHYGAGYHLTEQVATSGLAAQSSSGLPPSRYGTGGFGGSTTSTTNATTSGYDDSRSSTFQSQTAAPQQQAAPSQPAAPPQQGSYVTNQFAADGLAQQAPPQTANVAPRYGDAFPGPAAGQGGVAPQTSPVPYGQPPQGGSNAAPTQQANPYAQQTPAGHGNQGHGNEGYGNQGYGNQGYGNEGYGNEGYGNQGSNPPADNRLASNRNEFQGTPQAPPQQAPPQQAPPQQPQTQTPAAPAVSQFAMDGFCPVTLVEQGKWQKGDARWGAVHQDKTYLFASQQGQQQFLASPDRYAPVLSGHDPVRFAETGQLVEGKREHGVFFGNRIFLFADEVALDRFSKHTDFYMDRVRQASAPQQQPAYR